MPNPQDESTSRGPLPLYCLAIAFIDNMVIAAVFPLLPRLSSQAGGSEAQWVWIVSANGLLLVVSPLLWGRVASCVSLKKIVMLTLVVKLACTTLLYASTLNWYFLVVNRIASGMMSGTPLALRLLLLSRAKTRDDRTRLISWITVVSSVGVGTGSMLSIAALSAQGSAEHSLLRFGVLLSALSFASIACAWRLPPSAGSSPVTTTSQDVSRTKQKLKYGDGRILLCHAALQIVVFAYPAALLLAAERNSRLTLALAATLIGLVAFIDVASQLALPFAVRRWRFKQNFLGYSLVCTLGCFCATASVDQFYLATLFIALAGGALRTLTATYGSEHREDNLELWLAANQSVNGGARVIAPLAAALVGSTSADAAFSAMLAASVIALLLLAFTRFE